MPGYERHLPRPDKPHVPGLYWDPRRGHWYARFTRNKTLHKVGHFAAEDYDTAVTALNDARNTPPCGTNRAYQRHIRNGEPTCIPCRTAHNEYLDQYRQQNRKAA